MARLHTQRYRIVSIGDPLRIGVADSHHADVRVVAKKNGPMVPYCVPNEVICAEVGRLLRLPIPPGGVIAGSEKDDEFWFGSFNFNLVGEDLPPIDPEEVIRQQPDLCTGITLFDMWIRNDDRRESNISMDAETKRVTLFDHSHALFGAIAGQGGPHLEAAVRKFYLHDHCLFKHLTTDRHFGKWLDRIERLPDDYLEEICQEAVGLGISEEESETAATFLKTRRDELRRIIRANQGMFRRIRDWSLFT